MLVPFARHTAFRGCLRRYRGPIRFSAPISCSYLNGCLSRPVNTHLAAKGCAFRGLSRPPVLPALAEDPEGLVHLAGFGQTQTDGPGDILAPWGGESVAPPAWGNTDAHHSREGNATLRRPDSSRRAARRRPG